MQLFAVSQPEPVVAGPIAAMALARDVQESAARRRDDPQIGARLRTCTESASELGFLMLIALQLEDMLDARYGARGGLDAQTALMSEDAALDVFDFAVQPAESAAPSIRDARAVGVVYDMSEADASFAMDDPTLEFAQPDDAIAFEIAEAAAAPTDGAGAWLM